MQGHKGHILFLVPYPPGVAASQRFRFEQYLEILRSEGYSYTIRPFYDTQTWSVLYKEGNFSGKAFGLIKGILRRWLLIAELRRYSQVFIHRETSPVGPAFIPWLIKFVYRKPIIFDFDDAIWIPNSSESNRSFRFLKRNSNALKLMKWAAVNSCGNEFLLKKASEQNSKGLLIPTTIDTEKSHDRVNDHPVDGKLIIGWTGSHSTVQYLQQILGVIQQLEKEFDFEFRVISDRIPPFTCKSLNYIKWNKETEIEDLACINIGIMPLPDDAWAEGKCGLKALQYMALGIPVLLSPLGVNKQIIEHGKHGFFCSKNEEWYHYMRKMILDRDLLRNLGSNTRNRIEEAYSVHANTSKFLLLFASEKIK